MVKIICEFGSEFVFLQLMYRIYCMHSTRCTQIINRPVQKFPNTKVETAVRISYKPAWHGVERGRRGPGASAWCKERACHRQLTFNFARFPVKNRRDSVRTEDPHLYTRCIDYLESNTNVAQQVCQHFHSMDFENIDTNERELLAIIMALFLVAWQRHQTPLDPADRTIPIPVRVIYV